MYFNAIACITCNNTAFPFAITYYINYQRLITCIHIIINDSSTAFTLSSTTHHLHSHDHQWIITCIHIITKDSSPAFILSSTTHYLHSHGHQRLITCIHFIINDSSPAFTLSSTTHHLHSHYYQRLITCIQFFPGQIFRGKNVGKSILFQPFYKLPEVSNSRKLFQIHQLLKMLIQMVAYGQETNHVWYYIWYLIKDYVILSTRAKTSY